MIMTLQDFWARQGCLIWQPYYTQVGAGTNNPATILRVLGPEPWNVAYVEPSVRPDDARYGENPNRLQMHYQFQVILKPDPGNPQELYLQSLAALGIDPRQHDIRFVEDNWESPALGAWGLGWEVWLDGQEITQFTYFQQAGGQVLDPVSVEITYGLERIAIALQRVGSFRQIQWGPERTYGDVNLQAEQEHSRYYFEIAEVERVRQMYDLFEAEANACLQGGLVLPALDYILKCSHTFNVLDARGAVGVTERQALFGRMRDLSRRLSEAYLAQRQQLEYPFVADHPDDQQFNPLGDRRQADRVIPAQLNQSETVRMYPSANPFLLEIGTEEIPAGDLDSALEQLRQRVPAWLNELRLEHGTIKVLGTPRRLVVHIENLAPLQPDLEAVVKGPPANRAFGPGGEPTQAGEGFARSKGIAVQDLQVREIDGGQYVVALVRQPGRAVIPVLSETLPGLIAGLRFDKSIRWNHSNVSFSRPIRWLLALYGETPVPFDYAGLRSGQTTRGLRFRDPVEFSIHSPAEYFGLLEEQGILLDPLLRQETILRQVRSLAGKAGGKIIDEPSLLAEVTNLVESPHALPGSFDPIYLKLPREVLISVMKKHQRYFPVYAPGEGGHLLPFFIAVRNGDREEIDLVKEGNEHVIRARFADASFFVREDRKRPLDSYLERLGTLIFQTKLGSMLDKSRRIAQLVEDLIPLLGLDVDEALTARRAAVLCKADLVTHMVIEMTSLQGVMGRYYALQSGESESTAQAIFEHYLPRFSGDSIPMGRPGLAVGLADRLDSLAGLFAAGLAPSGNKDPFGLRRAALGLVQNLITWNLDLDVRTTLQAAAVYLPLPANQVVLKSVTDFVIERLRNLLLEGGARYDVVDAVLASQGFNPSRSAAAVRQLSAWTARPDWSSILPAYARCVRITRSIEPVYTVQPGALIEKSERELWEALQTAQAVKKKPGEVDACLNAFLPMIPTINLFFDEVLVMAEDLEQRQNRLGLLQQIASLTDGVADFSRLEGF